MEENSTMENQQVENEEVVNNATEGANAETAAEQTPEEQIKALEEKCAKLHDDYIRLCGFRELQEAVTQGSRRVDQVSWRGHFRQHASFGGRYGACDERNGERH